MSVRIITCLLLLSVSLAAQAGLVINGSRIIYDEDQGEASVHMRYVGDSPILLQVWVDSEELPGETPGEQESPFILTPAVSRVDPGNGQTIRILRTRGGLPQDRESVFYFNTLEVPPSPTGAIAEGNSFMQFSIRGRLKLFYRPRNLPSASHEAINTLQFSLAEFSPDGYTQVRVYNPSPYHVTFSTLALRQAGNDDTAEPLAKFNTYSPGPRMVPPMGQILVPMHEGAWASPNGASLPAGLEVDFTIINDAGGFQTRQQRLG